LKGSFYHGGVGLDFLEGQLSFTGELKRHICAGGEQTIGDGGDGIHKNHRSYTVVVFIFG